MENIIGEVQANVEIEKVKWITRNDIDKYSFIGNCFGQSKFEGTNR